jgi:hypothetical protein
MNNGDRLSEQLPNESATFGKGAYSAAQPYDYNNLPQVMPAAGQPAQAIPSASVMQAPGSAQPISQQPKETSNR